MRMQIYFNDEESDFVKSREPGFVRNLVRERMYELGILSDGMYTREYPKRDIKIGVDLAMGEDSTVVVKDGKIEELKKLDPTITTANEVRKPMWKEKQIKKMRGKK